MTNGTEYDAQQDPHLITEKNKVFDYVKLSLGSGMVNVELDQAHYEMALSKSFDVYRQRSTNAVEESYGFLELVADQQEYILPSSIQMVREVFRRSTGGRGSTGQGAIFEPFEAGYVNSYLLQAGRIGGLATYELYSQYQEQIGKMFGGFINFTFEPVSKKLTIVRKVRSSGEDVLLWLYNEKPDVTLLRDTRCKSWLYDYTLARCKYMLGEARSKFVTIAGPQGGTSLNGEILKSEAQQEIDKLEQDLVNLVDGSMPLTWIIG